MRKDFVQAHVEKLLERILEQDKVHQDDDGDWPLPLMGGGHMWISVIGDDDDHWVWLRAYLDGDVPLSALMLFELNDVNASAGYCRVYWQDGRVVIEQELVAGDLDLRELQTSFWAVQTMSRRLREERLGNWMGQSDLRDA